MKGIVVCVDYDDLLAITLPRNARHLTEIVVVSTAGDSRTAAVVKGCPNARLFRTDAFTRGGANFNKGAALEEAFDALGRDGWILIWDADTLLPDVLIGIESLDPGRLYGAKRRLLIDPGQYRNYSAPAAWKKLPLSAEVGWPGYFQLFHGSCSRLKRPWYATHSAHAAIGDAHFQNYWPTAEKGWLPFEVLHLGPRDTNWFGRSSPRLDGGSVPMTAEEVDRLFVEHKWRRK